jgi:hypothetical protein
MPTQTKKKGRNGNKKHGRSARKAARRGNPLSLFVRGKIQAAAYFSMTGQPIKG